LSKKKLMHFAVNPHCNFSSEDILKLVRNFKNSGRLFGDGKRNKIKVFTLNGLEVNVKSFKVPGFFNSMVYKYFRKSKARRSFEYGCVLLEKGIGTPLPVAFYENVGFFGLKDSYYVSEHLECDLTFRELVTYPDFENHDLILRQFTRFSYLLHEKGIEFLDHSPGNTLIKKSGENQYEFYLVDLNRMKFHDTLEFQTRMKNLSHLTPKREMVEVISDEYAKLSGLEYNTVFNELWRCTSDFQRKFKRKKELKQKLKFWR